VSSYDGEWCPTCGENENLRWIDSTPTSDTWGCKACGWAWVIEVGSPGQTDTKLMERAEING
jgi:ribosomal protein L37AE/L43A